MTVLAFLLALSVSSPPSTISPALRPPLQTPQEAQDPNTLQYQNIVLGLKFSYPKAWELVTLKNGESRLLVPIENTSHRGVVEVMSVNFRSEPDRWQTLEAAFNKSKHRTVERQWSEEILAVPLLLTRATYSENGNTRTSESGLLYTLGFNKMQYRVTAAPEEFDNVNAKWREVLQSLRTWDGSMPTAEDPSVKIAIKDPKDPKNQQKPPVDDVPHPQVPHVISTPKPAKLVKSPVATTLDLSGVKTDLRIPSDWTLSSDAPNVYLLKNSGLASPVTLTVYAASTSDPAATALFRLSAKSLNDFTKVNLRGETLPTANKAGQPIAQIWRAGVTGAGELFSCEACGVANDGYFLLTYRTTNPSRYPAERRLIESLLDRMSLEPAP